MTRKDDGSFKPKMDVISVDPAEVIVDNDPIGPDHPRYRAARWIAERLGQMPDADRELALELLRDPNNVAAFLTAEPDEARWPRPMPDA